MVADGGVRFPVEPGQSLAAKRRKSHKKILPLRLGRDGALRRPQRRAPASDDAAPERTNARVLATPLFRRLTLRSAELGAWVNAAQKPPLLFPAYGLAAPHANQISSFSFQFFLLRLPRFFAARLSFASARFPLSFFVRR